MISTVSILLMDYCSSNFVPVSGFIVLWLIGLSYWVRLMDLVETFEADDTWRGCVLLCV